MSGICNLPSKVDPGLLRPAMDHAVHPAIINSPASSLSLFLLAMVKLNEFMNLLFFDLTVKISTKFYTFSFLRMLHAASMEYQFNWRTVAESDSKKFLVVSSRCNFDIKRKIKS